MADLLEIVTRLEIQSSFLNRLCVAYQEMYGDIDFDPQTRLIAKHTARHFYNASKHLDKLASELELVRKENN